jgi:drug/metabolite transporter (DMT)-like permease
MTPSATRPDASTVTAFLAVAVLGGLNAIAVKRTVVELAPLWSAGLRFLLAGLLLVGYILVAHRAFPRGRSLSGAVLYGVVAFACSYALLYTAIQDVPAGTAMIFICIGAVPGTI